MLRIAIAALTVVAFTLPTFAQTTKKTPSRQCSKFNQAGKKIYYNCAQKPSMQDELAAQEKIKANQPPKPTTQQCQMVNGNLVCK